MPTEANNSKYTAGDRSGLWNDRVNLEIIETGSITSVVGRAPGETDFDQGVGCVTSSTYVKSVNVVKAVPVYGNQALGSNRKGCAAICTVLDFHLGELCSVSDALERKT